MHSIRAFVSRTRNFTLAVTVALAAFFASPELACQLQREFRFPAQPTGRHRYADRAVADVSP